MKLEYPKEWFERSAEIEGTSEVGAGCPAVPCSLLTVIERPLLTSGQLSVRKGVPTILIDSEQEHPEKLVSLWHEVVHLLRAVGGYSQDETDVEEWAKRLAATCPDALAWVGIHEANSKLSQPTRE